MSEQQSVNSRDVRSVRLIFSYEGDEVWLESRQPLTMAAPPGDPVEGDERPRGFWSEVRDAEGAVLHRRAMHNPIRHHVEVFSPDPEQPISWVPVERPAGAFAVLVPLLRGADHAALMAVPAAGTAALAPAVELHRVSLTEES